MAMVKQSGEKITSPHPAIKLPKLPWTQILAISIFWLGLNFHQNRARMLRFQAWRGMARSFRGVMGWDRYNPAY